MRAVLYLPSACPRHEHEHEQEHEQELEHEKREQQAQELNEEREPECETGTGAGGWFRSAMDVKRRLASNAHSDHMALLRAFHAWQRACTDNNELQFCARHRLSSHTLRLILELRTQILGHVRANGFIRPRGSGDIRDLNANRYAYDELFIMIMLNL